MYDSNPKYFDTVFLISESWHLFWFCLVPLQHVRIDRNTFKHVLLLSVPGELQLWYIPPAVPDKYNHVCGILISLSIGYVDFFILEHS